MNSNGTELEEVIHTHQTLDRFGGLNPNPHFKSLSGFQASLLVLTFATFWKPVHTATKSGRLSGFQSSLLVIDFRYVLETCSLCDEEGQKPI